jgi:hypothetical protein
MLINLDIEDLLTNDGRLLPKDNAALEHPLNPNAVYLLSEALWHEVRRRNASCFPPNFFIALRSDNGVVMSYYRPIEVAA